MGSSRGGGCAAHVVHWSARDRPAQVQAAIPSRTETRGPDDRPIGRCCPDPRRGPRVRRRGPTRSPPPGPRTVADGDGSSCVPTPRAARRRAPHPVGVAHGRQPVRDRDGGAPTGQLVERPLQGPLRGGVDAEVARRGRAPAGRAGWCGPPPAVAAPRRRTGDHRRRRPSRARRQGGDQVGHLGRRQRRPTAPSVAAGRARAGCRAPTRARGSSPARRPHDRGEHVGVEVAHVDAVDGHPAGIRVVSRASSPATVDLPSRSARPAPASAGRHREREVGDGVPVGPGVAQRHALDAHVAAHGCRVERHRVRRAGTSGTRSRYSSTARTVPSRPPTGLPR